MSTSSAVNYLRELVARPWSKRTASAMAYTVCHEALSTIELLENILLNLPTQDLLRAQRVCHHWRSTIENSSPLQENLFFKPVASRITWLAEITNLPSGQGPLPRQYASNLRLSAAVPTNSPEHISHHGLTVTPVELNWLCFASTLKPTGSRDKDTKYLEESRAYVPRDTAAPFRKGIDRYADLSHPLGLHHSINMLDDQQSEPSWQKMFISQPPAEYVTVTLDSQMYDMSGFDNEEMALVRFRPRKLFVKGGVRLGALIDCFRGIEEWQMDGQRCGIILHGAVPLVLDFADVVAERTEQWRRYRRDMLQDG